MYIYKYTSRVVQIQMSLTRCRDFLHRLEDSLSSNSGIEAPDPKASCSVIAYIWALKGLPYHHFGVYVYATKLHGALE